MRTSDILDHLEKFIAFKVIAEQGSLRKASEKLNISQPSLSVKLQTLEDALEHRLFERSRRGIVLTQEGQKTLRFVETLIESAEQLTLEIEESTSVLQGHIRIGVYDSIARYMWPGFYHQFSKTDPNISMSIITGRSQFIVDQLIANKIDLALTIEPQSNYEMDVEYLYSDQFSFFCNQKFANRTDDLVKKGKEYQIRKSHNQPISTVLFSKAISENGMPLERLLKNNLTQGLVIHRVENFEIAHSFCLEGVGMAVLPNKVAQREYEKNKLFKVKVDSDIPTSFGSHRIGLSLLKTQKNKPLIQHVANSLKAHIDSLG